MNRVFAEINAAGDRIECHFRYDADNVRTIKEVPGASFVGRDKGGPHWTVPLNLDVGRRLREEFGRYLVLGKHLKQWGTEQVKRERNMHTLAAADDCPAEDLVIGQKLPELTKWFRPYQRADVKYLSAGSMLNLNEQGLGKTTEIIGAIFESDLEAGPHLVVAPKTSLDTVWRYEIERWTDHEVLTYHGDLSYAERERVIDEFWACIEDGFPVWFVCTPQTIRDGKEPGVDEWASFTIDEYHRTGLTNVSGKKGTGTKFGESVRDINAKRRYAVTGTPMGGKPIKLWGGLHYLYPEQFKSKWAWARLWLNISDNGYGKDIGGLVRGREDEFYKSIAPYAVRRLKSEVLPQLPPKQYVDVWCDMTKKQKKQYDSFARDAETTIEEQQLNAIGILAEYTRLKVFADAYCAEIEERSVKCSRCDGSGMEGICPKCGGLGRVTVMHPVPSEESGKLPYLIDRLNEVGIDPKEPEGDACAIIASQFRDMVDMVHAYLNRIGIKAEKITGDVTVDDRTEIQQRFQAGGKDAPRVVVMTTTAGGVSITLDKADTVHILDETWVPDDQEQFEDRAHRASRMHQVTVYYYRSIGTVEEYIHRLVGEKAKVNKEILDLRRQGFRANMKEAMLSGATEK